MTKKKAMTKKTDTASNDPRDYDPLYWIDITTKQLQAKGLIYDSGERRDGQIVWKITPAGRKVADIAAHRHGQNSMTSSSLRSLTSYRLAATKKN